jgi:hypothetical protein
MLRLVVSNKLTDVSEVLISSIIRAILAQLLISHIYTRRREYLEPRTSNLVALCARDRTTSSSELHGSPIARCLQTVRLPCNVSCVLFSLPNTAELAGGCDAAVHVDSATTTRTPPLTTFFTLLHFPLPGGGWLVA